MQKKWKIGLTQIYAVWSELKAKISNYQFFFDTDVDREAWFNIDGKMKKIATQEVIDQTTDEISFDEQNFGPINVYNTDGAQSTKIETDENGVLLFDGVPIPTPTNLQSDWNATSGNAEILNKSTWGLPLTDASIESIDGNSTNQTQVNAEVVVKFGEVDAFMEGDLGVSSHNDLTDVNGVSATTEDGHINFGHQNIYGTKNFIDQTTIGSPASPEGKLDVYVEVATVITGGITVNGTDNGTYDGTYTQIGTTDNYIKDVGTGWIWSISSIWVISSMTAPSYWTDGEYVATSLSPISTNWEPYQNNKSTTVSTVATTGTGTGTGTGSSIGIHTNGEVNSAGSITTDKAVYIGEDQTLRTVADQELISKKYMDANSGGDDVVLGGSNIIGGSKVVVSTTAGVVKESEKAIVTYFSPDDRTYYSTYSNRLLLGGAGVEDIEIVKGTGVGGTVYIGKEFDDVTDNIAIIVNNDNGTITTQNLDANAIEAGGDASLITKKYLEDNSGSGGAVGVYHNINVAGNNGVFEESTISITNPGANNAYVKTTDDTATMYLKANTIWLDGNSNPGNVKLTTDMNSSSDDLAVASKKYVDDTFADSDIFTDGIGINHSIVSGTPDINSFNIDLTGGTDGQVLAINSAEDDVEWVDIASEGTPIDAVSQEFYDMKVYNDSNVLINNNVKYSELNVGSGGKLSISDTYPGSGTGIYRGFLDERGPSAQRFKTVSEGGAIEYIAEEVYIHSNGIYFNQRLDDGATFISSLLQFDSNEELRISTQPSTLISDEAIITKGYADTNYGGGADVKDAIFVSTVGELKDALEVEGSRSIYITNPITTTADITITPPTAGSERSIYGESLVIDHNITFTAGGFRSLRFHNKFWTTLNKNLVIGSNIVIRTRNIDGSGSLSNTGAGTLKYEAATITVNGGTQEYWDNTNTGSGSSKYTASYKPKVDGGDVAWTTNTKSEYVITVQGARIDDSVTINPNSSLYDKMFDGVVSYHAYVSSENTVKVGFRSTTYLSLVDADEFTITVI